MERQGLNRASGRSGVGDPFLFEKREGILRVASYNIRIDHPDDRENHHAWLRRRPAIVQLIRMMATDLVALQEANSAQADELRTLLPHYQFVGYPVGTGAAGEERLLFGYLSARLHLRESAIFSLSPTPSAPTRAWDARYPRACLYAKFLDRVSGKYLAVFNTHFDHVGIEARRKSVEVVAHLQQNLGRDAVRLLLGDFNPFPDAEGDLLYDQLLTQTRLRDVRDAAILPSLGPDGSWIGWEYDRLAGADGKDSVGCRLDHLFLGGPVEVDRTAIIHASIAQLIPSAGATATLPRDYPSDHLPLLADLSL